MLTQMLTVELLILMLLVVSEKGASEDTSLQDLLHAALVRQWRHNVIEVSVTLWAFEGARHISVVLSCPSTAFSIDFIKTL